MFFIQNEKISIIYRVYYKWDKKKINLQYYEINLIHPTTRILAMNSNFGLEKYENSCK